MSDLQSPITPATLTLLAQQAGVTLRPEEIEPLCRVYLKLNRMKALVRQPRNYDSPFAHTFEVRPVQTHRDLDL